MQIFRVVQIVQCKLHVLDNKLGKKFNMKSFRKYFVKLNLDNFEYHIKLKNLKYSLYFVNYKS